LAVLPLGADLSSLIPSQVTDIATSLGLDFDNVGRTTGDQVKRALGLENFPYVMIQKIIDVGMHIYVIHVDSRRPSIYLSPFRIKSSDVSQVRRIKHNGLSILMKKPKMTIPMPIERVSMHISGGTIIILNDLGGQSMLNHNIKKKMKESNDIIIMDYTEEK